jgi:hypothetical protein
MTAAVGTCLQHAPLAEPSIQVPAPAAVVCASKRLWMLLVPACSMPRWPTPPSLQVPAPAAVVCVSRRLWMLLVGTCLQHAPLADPSAGRRGAGTSSSSCCMPAQVPAAHSLVCTTLGACWRCALVLLALGLDRVLTWLKVLGRD